MDTIKVEQPAAQVAGFTELAVAVGRIEEKVSGISKMEERLRIVENTVERLEARQPSRVSGWTIASAILGIPASLGALIALVLVLTSK